MATELWQKLFSITIGMIRSGPDQGAASISVFLFSSLFFVAAINIFRFLLDIGSVSNLYFPDFWIVLMGAFQFFCWKKRDILS